MENDSDFLTEHQSLAAYAKTADVDSIYAKKSDIPEAVDLSGYYSKADVDALLAEMNAKITKLDLQLNPPIVNGAILKAVFSVSDSTKICFSQGNLQYQASASTWRFADNQWDFVGDATNGTVYENEIKCDNANISETYDGWIDLFGWGTSGYNGKNPYMTSKDESDYGDGDNDIAGTNYDWGFYNKIFNGGNQAGLWRTLTKDEWVYLIFTRTDAKNKKGFATINNVKGLVLMPDDWTLPEGLTFTSGAGYAQNTYSTADWAKMEANGAVFLPASGNGFYNTATNVCIIRDVCSRGFYWSSTPKNTDSVYDFDITDNDTERSDWRYLKFSVRLVQDVEE